MCCHVECVGSWVSNPYPKAAFPLSLFLCTICMYMQWLRKILSTSLLSCLSQIFQQCSPIFLTVRKGCICYWFIVKITRYFSKVNQVLLIEDCGIWWKTNIPPSKHLIAAYGTAASDLPFTNCLWRLAKNLPRHSATVQPFNNTG